MVVGIFGVSVEYLMEFGEPREREERQKKKKRRHGEHPQREVRRTKYFSNSVHQWPLSIKVSLMSTVR
jgi:hypothetical protein